jgi:probable DNA metabolism protein
VDVAVQVPLSHQADITGFHAEATRLLTRQVPPETIEWSASPAESVDEQELDPTHAAIRNRAARAIIPQSFVRMSELVVLHRDTQRFDLLYRILWRLVHEPEVKNDPADPDMARLRQMAQAVRRDMQKMKTKLVFRPLELKGQRVAVAWYEPSHYIGELVGAWLARSEPVTPWVLLTPDRNLRWDGRRLLSAPAVAPPLPSAAERRDEDWARVLDAMPWV